jgi:signal transduction histidine kinase
VPSEVQAGALLLFVVLAVNGVAVWSILSARDEARNVALQELALQTDAQARALEAALATLRGDFIFLSYSPPLSRAPAAATGEDPVTRRWSRLAIEGSIILFLEAHPSVERIQVRTTGGTLVAAGRRQGLPVLLPPSDELSADPGRAGRLVRVSWPLGPERAVAGDPEGSIEALLDPVRLLTSTAPGQRGRMTLELDGAGEPGSFRHEGALVARAGVVDERWTPPIRWTLVRREDGGRLIRSVERLAGRYRTTVALNVLVMSLTLVLGLVAFRQVRRAARAEAESRHQARVGELERQVRHSERLASLGRLSAGIAHEINNPLEGMRNYLELLGEDLAAGDAAQAAGLVPRVREGLERVAAIVRQVLRFGDPGRAPNRPVDLDAVVCDTLELVRADRRFSGVALHPELTLGPAHPVDGNPTTLGQLVLNLVINACQAQPAGGEVTVATAPRDGRGVLTVADRGPGFSGEVLEHLFEPFFSTRGSAGLGLAVSHGIVAEHGGSIRGENREGGGGRVVVELPLATAGPDESPTEAPGRPEPYEGGP